jgi:hypothetical protein
MLRLLQSHKHSNNWRPEACADHDNKQTHDDLFKIWATSKPVVINDHLMDNINATTFSKQVSERSISECHLPLRKLTTGRQPNERTEAPCDDAVKKGTGMDTERQISHPSNISKSLRALRRGFFVSAMQTSAFQTDECDVDDCCAIVSTWEECIVRKYSRMRPWMILQRKPC